jgi:hypothetical protein
MPATGEESAQGEYTLVEGYLELRQSSGKRQSESAKSPRGWEGCMLYSTGTLCVALAER